jgi:hydroxypyruvate reductase
MNLPELRQSAQVIWEASLNAASPATCIRRLVRAEDNVLFIAGQQVERRGKLVVIGAGKASARMAQVIEEIIGSHITGGLVVTKHGHSLPLQRIELVEAGHPIPDAAGHRAAIDTRKLLDGLTAEDVVLCLISGGASALWTAPAEGITLEEIQEVTSMLLRAGATIREMNAVRKHLSAIAGGQLANWAAPAHVISLIISDVIGDPIDFIGSGPTDPDTTSFSDASAIIQKYGIEVPDAVRQRIEQGARGQIPETPKPGDPVFKKVSNHIIANNRLLVDAAAAKARELNFNTLILGTEVEGEAKEIGGFFAALAREIGRSGNPVKPPACILAAGETIVTVHGHGSGGRNQEMALAWAISIAARAGSAPACFASVASDGTDGPTTAAGGIVDHFTCSRGIELGLIPLKYLQANDSSNFLKATGDLIVTGPTQTNLMDLQILLVG